MRSTLRHGAMASMRPAAVLLAAALASACHYHHHGHHDGYYYKAAIQLDPPATSSATLETAFVGDRPVEAPGDFTVVDGLEPGFHDVDVVWSDGRLEFHADAPTGKTVKLAG